MDTEGEAPAMRRVSEDTFRELEAVVERVKDLEAELVALRMEESRLKKSQNDLSQALSELRAEHQRCASVQEAIARDGVAMGQANTRLLTEKIRAELSRRALREAAEKAKKRLDRILGSSMVRQRKDTQEARDILTQALRGSASGAGETGAVKGEGGSPEASGASHRATGSGPASSSPALAPPPSLCECGHTHEIHGGNEEGEQWCDNCPPSVCEGYVPRQPPEGGEKS